MKVAIVFMVLAVVVVVRGQSCTGLLGADTWCQSDPTLVCNGGDVEKCSGGFCVCESACGDCSNKHCQQGHAHCGSAGHCVCP
ncbi:hypothetical protein DPMN_072944 [Dreissena polymorpha]|uniref:Uncharacterized protein n=1 Tax=Dreissena polymorpha TaxID=45954 RepID=A0A9D4HCG8_DREPO|nr:hypothetical protein DPMN_072944 [Dreissena polymorpha]